MKNQFFGDTRDLFKYDVVLELLLKTSIRQFTFIPMLTPRAANRHGGKTDYSTAKAGTRRTELARFLQACIRADRRRIGELETFFRTSRLTRETPLTIYREDQYFSDANREKYFTEIPPSLLREAVILLDPDNGLEIQRPTEAHLLYAEVGGLYERRGEAAALMVFQFFPFEPRSPYIARRCRELEAHTGGAPVAIWSSQLSFLFLARSSSVVGEVRRALRVYEGRYGGRLHVGP